MSVHRLIYRKIPGSYLPGRLLLGFAIANFIAIGSIPSRSQAQSLEDSLEESIEIELDDELDSDSTQKPAKQSKKNEKKADKKEESEELDLEVNDESAPVADQKEEAAEEEDLKLDEPDMVVEPETTPEPEADDLGEPSLNAEETPAPEQKTEPVVSESSNPRSNARSVRGLFDEPNYAFEKRLSRRSKNYKPVGEQQWEELIGDRRQELYAIQGGDTLWDISQTFFGDGGFWAKLWSQNGVIENPHVIVPGRGIRFVAGNESSAPSIDVVETLLASADDAVLLAARREGRADPPVYREQAETEISQAEIDAGVVVESDELLPSPQLPSPRKTVQLLKELPASFREKRIDLRGVYDSSGLDVGRSRAQESAATVFVNSFIADKPIDRIGVIDEIEIGEKFAAIGQDVFLKLSREIEPGARLTVVQNKGEIERGSGRSAATVYDVQGILEVSSPVDAGKRIYRATVVGTVGPVTKGALVITEAPPKTNYARTGTPSEVEVRIIGGEFDTTRRLLGANAVVYLNGGTRAGLKVGDILGVNARRGGHRTKTEYPGVWRTTGTLKVVDARQTVATAIVLESNDQIIVGDATGGERLRLLPDLVIETAEDASGKQAPRQLIEEDDGDFSIDE